MALSIRVDSLDADGISLLSPTRPEFDDVARPLLGQRIADTGLELKPMLVIVSNENVQAVVSFSLVWQVTHPSGHSTRFWGHTSFPGAICGDAAIGQDSSGLATGQRRIEANGIVIHRWGDQDEYFDQFLGQFIDQKNVLLRNAVDLHIELNAAILADGTLLGGDDQSRLTDLFSTYVQAKQDWYRGIIEALDAGRSVAESFAPVERFLADATDRMRARERLVDGTHAELWRHQAAAEARSWRRRHSDDDILQLLKQSIRLEPFTIRRR